MKSATLMREQGTDQGTFGRLRMEDFECATLELPERGNQRGYSRIPAGEYLAVPFHSQKFGACWVVGEVKDRSYILFHSGNYAGDVLKGWKTHSRGCILVGRSKAFYKGQMSVTASKTTMRRMRAMVPKDKSFTLEVINA